LQPHGPANPFAVNYVSLAQSVSRWLANLIFESSNLLKENVLLILFFIAVLVFQFFFFFLCFHLSKE